MKLDVLVEVLHACWLLPCEQSRGIIVQLFLIVLELSGGESAFGISISEPLHEAGLQLALQSVVLQPFLLQLRHLPFLGSSDGGHLFQRHPHSNIQILNRWQVCALSLVQLFCYYWGELCFTEYVHEVWGGILFPDVVPGGDELVDLLSESSHVAFALGDVLYEGRADLHCCFIDVKIVLINWIKDPPNQTTLLLLLLYTYNFKIYS